jgi:hypothetical protein
MTDDAPDRAFGEYTLETETRPDGRTIRYYAWPSDTDSDDTTGPTLPDAR